MQGYSFIRTNDKFLIKNRHSLIYEQYNYIKEILAFNKIKKDEASEDEMKLEGNGFENVLFASCPRHVLKKCQIATCQSKFLHH